MSNLDTLKSIEKALLSIKARLVLPEDETKSSRINDLIDEVHEAIEKQ